MKSNPLVSIIVVNYNTSHEVLDMLSSLDKCAYSDYELILVDNASPKDDLSFIKAKYPSVRVIMSSKNLGFAGANNLGIDAAKGTYCLFLNPDTCVTPGFLQPLVDTLAQNPTIGLVSPKIKYYDSPELIQYAGTSRMSKYTMRSNSYSKKKEDNAENSTSKLTGYGHGAAMMLPKAVIDKVGKMNASYFLYYEEIDWCERIHQKGYQIYYQANSLVFHKESASIQKESPLKIFYLSRNRLLFAKIHYTMAQFIFYCFYTLFLLVPKHILKYIRQPALLKAYLKGILSHLFPSITA
jgi:GT2 family glycosyltransferase